MLIMTAEGWRPLLPLAPDVAQAGRALPRGASKAEVVAAADAIFAARRAEAEARMAEQAAAWGVGEVQSW